MEKASLFCLRRRLEKSNCDFLVRAIACPWNVEHDAHDSSLTILADKEANDSLKCSLQWNSGEYNKPPKYLEWEYVLALLEGTVGIKFHNPLEIEFTCGHTHTNTTPTIVSTKSRRGQRQKCKTRRVVPAKKKKIQSSETPRLVALCHERRELVKANICKHLNHYKFMEWRQGKPKAESAFCGIKL